ncbi:lytic transglycosylase [Methylobacterium nonmethylotrophicum]|uniref:Lytic transglycosylase n=1 Tax=Methylobacterium nonmethylotrophicum TaxID=1141884 RepID=A0A4Z0NKW7_9HYPH|nr:lytic transglycosylase [Methylobacterium nonmethylotrophicum]
MAFGKHKKISPSFKNKVIAISGHLGCDPSYLMAAMAFETGETFRPDIVNQQSGATGLIQFMPDTAVGLGTTTTQLAQMTAVQQLDFVELYLKPYTNKMHNISDVYMTILYPAAVGKSAAHILFKSPAKAYQQNKGLDANKDGTITKAEASAKVYNKLIRGLKDEFRG